MLHDCGAGRPRSDAKRIHSVLIEAASVNGLPASRLLRNLRQRNTSAASHFRQRSRVTSFAQWGDSPYARSIYLSAEQDAP